MLPSCPRLLVRSVSALALALAASLWPLPSPVAATTFGTLAPASPDEVHGGVAQSDETNGFLHALVGEINARRARLGHPPVAIAPAAANAGVTRYLADLTPHMLASGICFHGGGHPVPPAWDYVASTGFGTFGNGEVLTCPDRNGYWTAARIAESWFGSGVHHSILYGDPSVNLVACGAFGPQGKSAYMTSACVTFQI